MPNYNESMIYKLCCKDTDIKEIYIGSTVNFRNRKWSHKSSCNNINHRSYNFKVYQFIREHGGWENWTMILIETVNCNTKLELHKIERKYIEELKPLLNKDIPSRDTKESNKEYRENNKEKLSEKRKEKITCECGCIVAKSSLTRHKKNKKHINLLSLNTQSVAH